MTEVQMFFKIIALGFVVLAGFTGLMAVVSVLLQLYRGSNK